MDSGEDLLRAYHQGFGSGAVSQLWPWLFDATFFGLFYMSWLLLSSCDIQNKPSKVHHSQTASHECNQTRGIWWATV